jgi:DNA invertase Pin-like site-specific DNA recombinase
MLVGYARVSTRDQNASMQEAALGKAGCERIFVETASGATAKRVELQKALEFVRKGDCLVVWKLDRLGRSLRDLIEIVSIMKDGGVRLRSLTERIDTTTPAGEMFFHLIGAMAQMERDLIRERTQEGLLRARALGRLNGRPKKLKGERLEAAKAMLQSGMPYSQAAKALEVSRGTLYRACPWEAMKPGMIRRKMAAAAAGSD